MKEYNIISFRFNPIFHFRLQCFVPTICSSTSAYSLLFQLFALQFQYPHNSHLLFAILRIFSGTSAHPTPMVEITEITAAARHNDFASSSTASGSSLSPFDHYDVFINLCDYNHSGRDVHTFATKLYDQLHFLQLQVFMDKPDLLFNNNILPSKIEHAIIAASVHIAIFSPNYAQSKWCLDELVLMTKSSAKSRSTIIPVFYYAKPSELRRTGKDHEGGYAKALCSYENQNLYDSLTIRKWRDALSQVAEISGFVLDDGHGGEEDLLNNVVQSVTSDFPFGARYDVFINHRGPDVKDTFARSLYDHLVSRGLRVFLDKPELEAGIDIVPQIEVAIQFAYVNIAIFSPNYAVSHWCLDELVLMVSSMNTILPVFYEVSRSDVLSPDDGVYKKALLEHERLQRCDSETLQDWRDALSIVAKLPGHKLDTCGSSLILDPELDRKKKELLNKTVQSVLENLAKRSEAVRNSEVQTSELMKIVLKENVRKCNVRKCAVGGAGNVTATTIIEIVNNVKTVAGSENNLQFLITDLARLEDILSDVRNQFEYRTPPQFLQNWLEGMKDALQEVTDLIARAKQHRRRCLRGFLFCNLKLRAQISEWRRTRFNELFRQLFVPMSIFEQIGVGVAPKLASTVIVELVKYLKTIDSNKNLKFLITDLLFRLEDMEDILSDVRNQFEYQQWTPPQFLQNWLEGMLEGMKDALHEVTYLIVGAKQQISERRRTRFNEICQQVEYALSISARSISAKLRKNGLVAKHNLGGSQCQNQAYSALRIN